MLQEFIACDCTRKSLAYVEHIMTIVFESDRLFLSSLGADFSLNVSNADMLNVMLTGIRPGLDFLALP